MLAARFALYVGDLDDAGRVCQKLLANSKVNEGNAPTVFELEAVAVKQWVFVAETEAEYAEGSADCRKKLQSIDGAFRGKGLEVHEVDSLMIWAKSRLMLNLPGEAINILNQVRANSAASVRGDA